MKKKEKIITIQPISWDVYLCLFLVVSSALMIIFDIRSSLSYQSYHPTLIQIISVIELIRRSASFVIYPDIICIRHLWIPIRTVRWSKITSASYFPKHALPHTKKNKDEVASILLTVFPGMPFFGGPDSFEEFRKVNFRYTIHIRLPDAIQEQAVSVIQNRLDAYGIPLKRYSLDG